MQSDLTHIELSDIENRQTTIQEIMTLRYDVLCAHRPRVEADFDGDTDAGTVHVGAFASMPIDAGDGETASSSDRIGINIGCASYMLTSHDGAPAWQLRGMAIDPRLCGRGVGKALLTFAHDQIAQAVTNSHVRLFWCRARVPAIGFYKKQGWRVVSDEYVVPNYGPHKHMVFDLRDA